MFIFDTIQKYRIVDVWEVTLWDSIMQFNLLWCETFSRFLILKENGQTLLLIDSLVRYATRLSLVSNELLLILPPWIRYATIHSSVLIKLHILPHVLDMQLHLLLCRISFISYPYAWVYNLTLIRVGYVAYLDVRRVNHWKYSLPVHELVLNRIEARN